MLFRYKSKAGKFADVDLSTFDKPRVDAVLKAHGFDLFATNPKDKVPLIPFTEFARMMGGQDSGPPLLGPQPNGSTGPVGTLSGAARPGAPVVIPI